MPKNPFKQAADALSSKPKAKATKKATPLPSLSAPKATVRAASQAAAQRKQAAAKSRYQKPSTNKGK